MQSYLRQEYEETSLATQIHVANCLKGMSVRPINLQHDGLVLATGRVGPEHLQRLLTEHCSMSLGYPQPVQIKSMPTHVAEHPY